MTKNEFFECIAYKYEHERRILNLGSTYEYHAFSRLNDVVDAELWKVKKKL